MRWMSGRRSDNVEDRRGLGGPIAIGGGGIGILVLALVVMYLGGDPSVVLQQMSDSSSQAPGGAPSSPYEDRLRDFVSVVLADTEDTWHELFQARGGEYRDPTLVLFSGAVESACGIAQSAVGPFYCPSDRKVYIDLAFYDDLKNRFGAPGDFAQAYVIAHEVGHHVQNLLGIESTVHAKMKRVATAEANQLSVRLELQADCLAGVWAYHANRSRQILEQGDVEEGLQAASAIGDDRLQWQAKGYVAPESFTHGSSAQRVRWFKRGLASGDVDACDTFGAESM